MSDTYCGKDCTVCTRKEELNCSGCKSVKDCELASCCRNKGHQTCDTCQHNNTCGTLRRKDALAQIRLDKRNFEIERIKQKNEKVPFYAKHYWILFWLVVPSVIASIMTLEPIVAVVPIFNVLGELLNLACQLIYGYILIKLSVENERFHTAGLCLIVVTILSSILAWLTNGNDEASWKIIIQIPLAITSVIASYNEYTGHSEILTPYNPILADKWTTLWKWEIMTIGLTFGSIVITLLIPLIGVLTLFAGLIGGIVVAVSKLVYLYQTSTLFKNYKQ